MHDDNAVDRRTVIRGRSMSTPGTPKLPVSVGQSDLQAQVGTRYGYDSGYAAAKFVDDVAGVFMNIACTTTMSSESYSV